MILRRRHSILICLLGLGLSAPAATGAAYLASVGPAPLRFFSFPPPPPPPPPSVTSNVPTAPPLPVETTNALNTPKPTDVPAPAVGPATDQTVPATDMNAATEPPGPADVVSPQMLLKYFNKSTNGPSTGIIAPLNLGTPQAQPPSSKATYSN